MHSTFPSVLTQFVTTTKQDGSVATSEVTLFPTATSQASSNSAHPVPVGTVIGIVGGITALLIFLLLLFLYRRRKASNHRFALMELGGNNVTQSKYIESCFSPISHSSFAVCSLDMSQNHTIVATPFTLGPSPLSSRLPLFFAMSEKALRQQTPANRPETDLEATSTPPDLSPSSNVPATSVSVPNTHASGSTTSNPNVETLTLKHLNLTLLNEPSDSSPLTGPQRHPEPNQPAVNNAAYRLRYLSGSTSIVGPSPPAYRPNNE